MNKSFGLARVAIHGLVLTLCYYVKSVLNTPFQGPAVDLVARTRDFWVIDLTHTREGVIDEYHRSSLLLLNAGALYRSLCYTALLNFVSKDTQGRENLGHPWMCNIVILSAYTKWACGLGISCLCWYSWTLRLNSPRESVSTSFTYMGRWVVIYEVSESSSAAQ